MHTDEESIMTLAFTILEQLVLERHCNNYTFKSHTLSLKSQLHMLYILHRFCIYSYIKSDFVTETVNNLVPAKITKKDS